MMNDYKRLKYTYAAYEKFKCTYMNVQLKKTHVHVIYWSLEEILCYGELICHTSAIIQQLNTNNYPSVRDGMAFGNDGWPTDKNAGPTSSGCNL